MPFEAPVTIATLPVRLLMFTIVYDRSETDRSASYKGAARANAVGNARFHESARRPPSAPVQRGIAAGLAAADMCLNMSGTAAWLLTSSIRSEDAAEESAAGAKP